MRSFTVAAIFIALFAWSGGARIHAEEGAPHEIERGISFSVPGETVELRVATAHAFCLESREEAAAAPARSVYLGDPSGALPSYKVVQDGPVVGLETAFGKLLVDCSRRRWSLWDAQGAVLADWAPLARQSPFGAPMHPPNLDVTIGTCPSLPHALYYGSGNNPNRGALTQQEGDAKTGNGTAMLPQFWSNAGYGALLIGASDNAPGGWHSDTSGRVHWQLPGGSASLYLCPATNLYEWLRDQAELTGFAPMPPRWVFGYMQSRWGWTDKAYLDETLAHFRRDQLPVDAFIIDFEWYTTDPDYTIKPEGESDFADFGWNPRLFPDPPTQIQEFTRQGLHLVGIRKPRLGNSANLEMARAKDWILPLNPDDPNGAGIQTRNLDYSKPEVRAWWGLNNRHFDEAGMAGFWNDEGECNYIEYSEWNIAEVALQQLVRPGARFWSLNRSFIPGMQRFGATVWTGDIDSDWQTLARTPGELLSYSLAGMPYSTCDIGGFGGNPTPELMTRWMQAGVFFPMMRAHSEIKMTPRFPWLYGSDAEAAIRQALELRYRLLPYYYSLSHENSLTGAPLMRPLVMEFPTDERAAALTDEWLMGKGVLAAPALREGGARSVYLPKDRWFDFESSHSTEGPQSIPVSPRLDEIPVYVRAGTLLPLGPVRQYTSQPSAEPLELQIYAGHDAAFDLVEDDGETRAGPVAATRITTFTWNEQARTLTWKVTGSYRAETEFKAVKAVLFTPQLRSEKQAALGQDGSVTFP
jgi:alpha-glucosidase